MIALAFYAVAVVSATFGLLVGCALGANARSRLVESLTADSAHERECA
jgi:Na+/glutamate symporter